MKICTTEFYPGKDIKENLGVVIGSTVRAKHVGKDLFAGLKQIIGGEIKGYTQMLEESREEAIKRMKAEAKKLGADAVVGVRIASAGVMPGAAEIVAYGTAVKLK